MTLGPWPLTLATMIIKVEMGEGVVAVAPAVITTIGCGSCVVLALYDAGRRIGGLAHIMMPEAPKPRELPLNPGTQRVAPLLMEDLGRLKDAHLRRLVSETVYQYADTAIPALLEELRKRGAARRGIAAKMAGGAMMFRPEGYKTMGVGESNVLFITEFLKRENIPVAGTDTGGSHGRNAELHLDSGALVVTAFGRERKVL